MITLTPWKKHPVKTNQYNISNGSVLIVNETGDRIVARCSEDNADLIIRACNSHYELLECLKRYMDEVEDRQWGDLWDKATAAIAKAEGK